MSHELCDGMQILLGLFAIDDFTGFEITKLVELPEPWGIIVVWGFVLPLVFVLVNAVTGLILKDGLILQVLFSTPTTACTRVTTMHTILNTLQCRRTGRGARYKFFALLPCRPPASPPLHFVRDQGIGG